MELVVDSKAMLGEGPCWDAERNKLYWVDIEGHRVHIYNPELDEDSVIDVGEYVGIMVPRVSGGFIVTLQHGFYHFDPLSETMSLIQEVEGDIVTNRFNDGKCDAYGRLWAGTMDINYSRRSGALYCIDSSLTVRKILEGITISNGLGWSPDNKHMYFIDTPTRQVVRFDFDLPSGTVNNGRVILNIDEGYPDGMCVDEEGMIWIAHWGGSKITRWNPDLGTLLDEIILRTSNVTSCTFGGKDLSDLYITTARSGLSVDVLASQPSAGGLFRQTTLVKGQPSYAFNG